MTQLWNPTSSTSRGSQHSPRAEFWGDTCELASRSWIRQAGLVIIDVTRIADNGNFRRAAVDTAGRDDAARWEQLAEQSALSVPLPYRPDPGQPVYEISAGDHIAQVAEKDLTGPLRELVTAVLAEGDAI